jgi:hypothetical protein
MNALPNSFLSLDSHSFLLCRRFIAKNKNADAKLGCRDRPQPFDSLEFLGIKDVAGRNSCFFSVKSGGELTEARGCLALTPQPVTSI